VGVHGHRLTELYSRVWNTAGVAPTTPAVDAFHVVRQIDYVERTRTMDDTEISNRFSFHPATTQEKRNEHTGVRSRCKELAFYINSAVPEGREKALALTHLEEVMHWANAAIAINNH
jgi:hypothetical protein